MGRPRKTEEERRITRQMRNARYYARNGHILRAARTPPLEAELRLLHAIIHEELQPITAFLINRRLPLYRTEFDFLSDLLVNMSKESAKIPDEEVISDDE
jgi:hypothetical protein